MILPESRTSFRVAVIGGGPAGLMAAEALALGGASVDVLDAMPSFGRKLLLAGRGGFNLTHSEALEDFLTRYGERRGEMEPIIAAFPPQALREWAHGLGVETFVGSSGRVFPAGMKAAPLLRAWLRRLREAGVRFHVRQRWLGWGSAGHTCLRIATPEGERELRADAVILALGGGSWARFGSDGAWVPVLEREGIAVRPLRPANCGFDVPWSEHFRQRFSGHALKTVAVGYADAAGRPQRRVGEFVITAHGVEGSLIYAISAPLRDRIAAHGSARIELDLVPGKELSRVSAEVCHPRGSRSLASHLQSRVGLAGVKAGLLRELLPPDVLADGPRLAAAIKALPLHLVAPRPLDEAISSAGGVAFEALDERLMLRARPGVFCAGEMLDWEAPTGGYLLTGCFATGRAAARGALDWLARSAADVGSAQDDLDDEA